MNSRTVRRLQLLAVFLLFAAPLLIALLLRAEHWRPKHTRNFGSLIDPPQDVSAARITLSDGGALTWRDPNRQWTLLAIANGACAQQCQLKLDQLKRARLTLNQNSERLRIVYLGAPLQPALIKELAPLMMGNDETDRFASLRPSQPDALAAALVDANGFLMLGYAAGFDANGLRKDLARMIR